MINGKYCGKKTRKDIIDSTNEAVSLACTYGIQAVGVNAEDASRKFCMSSGHFRSIYKKLFKISSQSNIIVTFSS